uniref:Uncharacterized protein n=1 Tax=viral metagenome TaxID=1070528 RepID=A0A6M3M2Y1_9ZZZZ
MLHWLVGLNEAVLFYFDSIFNILILLIAWGIFLAYDYIKHTMRKLIKCVSIH